MRVVARKQGRAAPLSRVSRIAKLAHRVVAHRLPSGRADAEASVSVLAQLDPRGARGRGERPLRPLSRCCSLLRADPTPELVGGKRHAVACTFDASSPQTAAPGTRAHARARARALGMEDRLAGDQSSRVQARLRSKPQPADRDSPPASPPTCARTASRRVTRTTQPSAFSANGTPRVAKNSLTYASARPMDMTPTGASILCGRTRGRARA